MELNKTVYAFDSNTIDICFAVFPWVQFCRRKSPVKSRDLRGATSPPMFLSQRPSPSSQCNSVDLTKGLIFLLQIYQLSGNSNNLYWRYVRQCIDVEPDILFRICLV